MSGTIMYSIADLICTKAQQSKILLNLNETQRFTLLVQGHVGSKLQSHKLNLRLSRCKSQVFCISSCCPLRLEHKLYAEYNQHTFITIKNMEFHFIVFKCLELKNSSAYCYRLLDQSLMCVKEQNLQGSNPLTYCFNGFILFWIYCAFFPRQKEN